VQADKIQYGNPDYRSELGFWLARSYGANRHTGKIAQLYVVLSSRKRQMKTMQSL
jgi:hypothetical protein